MLLFELFNESGYTPPNEPHEYHDVDKLWDYLKIDEFSQLNEILKLRDYIFKGSSNYTIPPKTAFGADEKKELTYALNSLKNTFTSYKDLHILRNISEIEDYLHSME